MTADSRRGWWLGLAIAVAMAVAVVGCYQTWFLCDDAFITFRYVGNLHDGNGFVWNPAPFQPVEGFTSWLWVVLLWAVWSVTGLQPPQSAVPITLLAGLLSLWFVGRRIGQLVLPERLAAFRPCLALAVLLGIAANHSFVTWLSSGMETSIFGLFCVLWTLHATARREVLRARDLALLGVYAAFANLTRPDGGLLVLATIGIGVHAWWFLGLGARAMLLAQAPALVTAAHFVWRYAYYGEWLPNTYYAKVVAAWPESGLRYLYCFVVEHGVWLWLPLALVWSVVAGTRRAAVRTALTSRFPATAAVGTWFGFVGYYSLIVGGDHFAYRPFTHLVPLLFLSLVVMLASLGFGWRSLLATLVLFGLSADTFGWWYEHALRGRERDGFVRASTALPAPLGALFTGWDRCQAWLRLRYVALPRGLHDVTCRDLVVLLPERRSGQVVGLPDGHRGVYRTVAAGVVSWALRDVAILDTVGLNDWVVARNPVAPPPARFDAAAMEQLLVAFDGNGDQRLDAAEIAAAATVLDFGQTGVPVSGRAWGDLLLAICDRDGDGLDRAELLAASVELQNPRHLVHEHTPPAGYIEALRPNVVLDGGRFRWVPGVAPLTDAEVVAVELEYRAKVRRK